MGKINNRSVGILRQNTGETRRTQAFWGAHAPRVLAIAPSRKISMEPARPRDVFLRPGGGLAPFQTD
ncbi:MAG: hypothetical protein WA849_16880 [Candidatus Udaeobacter sp.]